MKLKPIWILHICVFVCVATLFVIQQMELSEKYNTGIKAAELGNYEQAVEYMSSIAEYRDAPTKAEDYRLEITYQKGLELIENQQWDSALEIFETILGTKDYKDADEKKYLCLYEQARRLAFEGDVRSAELIYIRLPLNFMDVEARKQVISDYKKFSGSWRCDENNLDLKTTVYIDYDNIPRIRAVISDHDGLLLDEPITLNGEGMEIATDRFSWAIYGKDSFSFVYGKDKFTVMKQPVVSGTIKHIFSRITGTNYDAVNSSYMSTNF